MAKSDKRVFLYCWVFLVCLAAYLVLKCNPSIVGVQHARPVNVLPESIPSLVHTNSSISPWSEGEQTNKHDPHLNLLDRILNIY